MKILKKSISLIILFIICVAALVVNGCTPIVNPINIVGSTSMQPVVAVLAEEFMKENKTITIDVDGGGSSAGIKAVLDGIAENESSSRALTVKEEESRLRVARIGNHKKIYRLCIE